MGARYPMSARIKPVKPTDFAAAGRRGGRPPPLSLADRAAIRLGHAEWRALAPKRVQALYGISAHSYARIVYGPPYRDER